MSSRRYRGSAIDSTGQHITEAPCRQGDGETVDVVDDEPTDKKSMTNVPTPASTWTVEVARPDPNGDASRDVDEDTATLWVDLQTAQDRIDDLEAENEWLRERADRDVGEALQPLEDYEALLEDGAVRAAIEEAKQIDRTSPRYTKGVIAAIVDEGGPVSYDDVAQRPDLSTTAEVSKAALALEAREIVVKDQRDAGMHVDLNVDGLNGVREAAARREETEALIEEL